MQSSIQHRSSPSRKFFQLPNGKRLAYVDFGPNDAEPVLLLHGAHGSAYYFSEFPDAPFNSRWRMIGVDRPGYGESEMWNHTYTELAEALRVLCVHLNLEQVNILGVSAGGAYALACGAVFPSMLRRIVSISAVAPLTPTVRRDINRTNRIVYWFAKNIPFLNRLNANFIARVSRENMESFLERSKGKFSLPDQREAEKEIVRQLLIASAKEAYPNDGRGLAQDLENQANPWDFSCKDVPVETHIWSSQEDTSSPPIMAQMLHEQLPHSFLHQVANAGHLWHICNFNHILEHSLLPT